MKGKGSSKSDRKPPRIASYGSGLDYHKEVATLVGMIIAKWNVVEYQCVGILADGLHCSIKVAEQMVYAVISSKARIEMIKLSVQTQLASFDADPTVGNKLGALLGRVKKCLTLRNGLAHGLYTVEKGRLRRVNVAGGFFDDDRLEKLSITVDGLKASLAEMSEVLREISDVTYLVSEARRKSARRRG